MPTRNKDLHGNAPDTSAVALLLIDVINDLEFEGSEALAAQALPMAEKIAALKARAKAAGIPAIYVNDNFGRWRSDFTALVARCLDEDVPGRPLAELLRPDEDDYFVLKPKHSGFYATALDILLAYLGVDTLILTGVAGNICVLFTASDAYIREFQLVVPGDCVASNRPEDNRHALEQMRDFLRADITPSTELDLESLKRAAGRAGQRSGVAGG